MLLAMTYNFIIKYKKTAHPVDIAPLCVCVQITLQSKITRAFRGNNSNLK